MKYDFKSLYFKVQRFTQGSFFQAGLPLIVFMLGGVYVLTYVQDVRIQYRDKSNMMVSIKELEAFTERKRNKKPKTIEDAYKDSQGKDIDKWENIRGPRPWEDSKSVQDEQRQKLRSNSS